jgi:hypothetical protein
MKKHIFGFLITFFCYYLITSIFDHQWKHNIVISLLVATSCELFLI